MESTFVINIGIYKALSLIAAIVIGAWYLSSRLTKVETQVEGFNTRLTNFEGRLDSAFGASSPISLKPAGVKALEESGLKQWIDEHKDALLKTCSQLKTAYDIQESAFKLFDQLDFGDFESQLKEAAFAHGWSVEIMRRIGGIYFRDICLKEHGFTPDDLDTPTSVQDS